MAKRRQKAKRKSETLELNILEVSPAELAKIAESEGLDRIGIYPTADRRGITFGEPRKRDQIDGEGLPEIGDSRGLFDQWKLNLDIRATYDREGNTYLEVARPGSGIHHQFKFNGMDYNEALRASGEFNNHFEDFLIYYAILFLFEASYWERAGRKAREESYGCIIRTYENYFKSILKPKRKREIEKRKIGPGLTLTTFESIEGGRPPGTKGTRSYSEKETTRINKRRQQIVHAIQQAHNNENKSELAQIIGISTPTLRTWLKGIGVSSQKDFYDLIRQVKSN